MDTPSSFLKISNAIQGSDEWKQTRAGLITCSELSKVLSKGQGLTRGKYLRQIAAELITGIPTESYSNAHMQRGTEQEEEARDLLALEFGHIEQVGFMWDPIKRVGCSLDGIIGEGIAEFKCCIGDIQVERLDKSVLPGEYKAQVQGSLWVTQKKFCKFQSYSPGLPRLVIHVEPDLEYFAMLEKECLQFNQELDELVSKISKMF